MTDWVTRFIELAEHTARWSKDPSTQVGAVIVNEQRVVVGVGYNGFPRGIADDERLWLRDDKHRIVVHAEINAVLNATASVRGGHLYTWPIPPCTQCAAMLINAGIAEVTSPVCTDPELAERWHLDVTERLLAEAGIPLRYV